jgi:hypothetical protein
MGQVLSGPFAKISHRPKTSRYKTHLRLFLATPIVGFILLPKQKKQQKKLLKKLQKKKETKNRLAKKCLLIGERKSHHTCFNLPI